LIEVWLNGAGKLVYKDVNKPLKIKEDQAIIKVISVGICGGDMRFYLGKEELKEPIVRGHEFGGIIKSLGNQNTEFKTGMKVVVNPAIYCGYCYYCSNSIENLCENIKIMGGNISGSMKEEIIVPIDNIFKLNDSFDLKYAPLIEPTAVATHAVNNIRNSTVLIIGVSMFFAK
jgi:threonine dehydrogenase-like Zn-dependent dehydrogenase